jgi:hypothetical protein
MPLVICSPVFRRGPAFPDAAVAAVAAGAGDDQVAHAAEAGEGCRLAVERGSETTDFDEAAGDQGGPGVVAEAESVADADGDGDDILERATDLNAGDVVAGVDAESVAVECVCTFMRSSCSAPRRRPLGFPLQLPRHGLARKARRHAYSRVFARRRLSWFDGFRDPVPWSR